ncbi:MAG: glycosyltransferase family 2 protein, partial [Ardenticatenaceae bacterium]
LPLSPSPPLPECVWLLNCDTEVVGDAPLQLVTHLREQASVGAVGPKLRYGDLSFQHSAFAFPGLSQLLLDLFPAPGRLLESRINGRYSPGLWAGKEAFPVDMLLGAALMIRGAAIEQVGLMDEGYFMYAEELDWCRALRHAGWQIDALPSAIVTHYGGQSTKQFRDRMFVALWRSRLRYYEKWESPAYVRLVRLLLRLGMAWQSRQARKQAHHDDIARRLAAYQEVAAL